MVAYRPGALTHKATYKRPHQQERAGDQMVKVNASGLLEAYKSGQRDFSGSTLLDIDIEGADLHGSTFRDCVFSGNMRSANLQDCNFDFANLSCVDMIRTKLAGSYLRLANMEYTYLADADLSRCDMRGAYLSDADLSHVTIRNADLSGANLRNAKLCGASLRFVNLTQASLVMADLSNCDLRTAIMDQASLKYAHFGGARIDPTSHAQVSEILRASANGDVHRQQIAGLVAIQIERCWYDFALTAVEEWTAADRNWIRETLSAYPSLRSHLEDAEASAKPHYPQDELS